MSFIKKDAVGALTALSGAHYQFPRSNELRCGFEWMFTDYYSKALSERPFEARGLLVTGPSRSGKSTEIRKLVSEVNAGGTAMPDERPARIASVVLNGTMTWKDLGLQTLRTGLSYPAVGRLTQRDVWERVLAQAKGQGVVGIHYDECQHIFPKKNAEARGIILDSFKTLLKQSEWPLMLILSGVDELTEHIVGEEQLSYLLRPLTFREIQLPDDFSELNSLCYSYAERAGVEFSHLSNADFYSRLAFACANRWGLVIEILIEALQMAVMEGVPAVQVEQFAQAFASRSGFSPEFTPFTIEAYEAAFEAQGIIRMLSREERRQGNRRKSR